MLKIIFSMVWSKQILHSPMTPTAVALPPCLCVGTVSSCKDQQTMLYTVQALFFIGWPSTKTLDLEYWSLAVKEVGILRHGWHLTKKALPPPLCNATGKRYIYKRYGALH